MTLMHALATTASQHGDIAAIVPHVPPGPLLAWLEAAVGAAAALHGPLLNRGAWERTVGVLPPCAALVEITYDHSMQASMIC